jgi:hypothetical protein
VSDFTVSIVSGNLAIVTPASAKEAGVLADRVSDEASWFGRSLVVELRYIEEFVDRLREDGYTVRT